MCGRLSSTAFHSITFIAHCWFATKILFILQDSLIRVSRRDEEWEILKEPAPVIVERAAISLANRGTISCSPTVKPKAHHRAPIGAFFFSSAPARAVLKTDRLRASRRKSPCSILYPPTVTLLFSVPRSVNQARTPPPPILFPLRKFRFF